MARLHQAMMPAIPCRLITRSVAAAALQGHRRRVRALTGASAARALGVLNAIEIVVGDDGQRVAAVVDAPHVQPLIVLAQDRARNDSQLDAFDDVVGAVGQIGHGQHDERGSASR